jgi:hypothetical protein
MAGIFSSGPDPAVCAYNPVYGPQALTGKHMLHVPPDANLFPLRRCPPEAAVAAPVVAVPHQVAVGRYAVDDAVTSQLTGASHDRLVRRPWPASLLEPLD